MDALILDLLQWLQDRPRPYEDVMEAWRTSCPRLTVWEDAIDAGYVMRKPAGASTMIAITEKGRRHLAQHRPIGTSAPSVLAGHARMQ